MDGITPETCDECGFDAAVWRRRDAVSYLGAPASGLWWRLALEDVSETALNERPATGVWSVLEYGVHTALVTALLGEAIERVRAEDGVDLGPAPVPPADDGSGEPSDLGADAVLADIEREASALVVHVMSGGDTGWTNVGVAGSGSFQAEALLLHAAHDASHHAFDVARALAALGAGAPPLQGRLVQINTSGGGVPKQPTAEGRVEFAGLAGDRQADRKHHGRPFQALCLWSTEVIDGLAADGHPIGAGSAGENLTLTGIDWDAMRPGALLRVGDVLAEISFPATPCAKQTQWFSDGDFGRLDHGRNPGLTRWYAWVREPGRVATGDVVELSPPAR